MRKQYFMHYWSPGDQSVVNIAIQHFGNSEMQEPREIPEMIIHRWDVGLINVIHGELSLWYALTEAAELWLLANLPESALALPHENAPLDYLNNDAGPEIEM